MLLCAAVVQLSRRQRAPPAIVVARQDSCRRRRNSLELRPFADVPSLPSRDRNSATARHRTHAAVLP